METDCSHLHTAHYTIVSEGLNSVETIDGGVVYQRPFEVSEGLNSVETNYTARLASSVVSGVSEGLNSVETCAECCCPYHELRGFRRT